MKTIKPDTCYLKVKFSYNGYLFKNETKIVDLVSRTESINEIEEVYKNLKDKIFTKGMFTNKELNIGVYLEKDFTPPLVSFKFERKDFKNGMDKNWDMENLEKELLNNLTIEIVEVSFKYKLKKS